MRRGLAREAPVVVWALALALLVLGPALGHGFLLVRDMVWVPDLALGADALGLGSGLPRAVPSDAVIAVLDEVVPGMLLQKLVLVLALAAGGVGAARLLDRDDEPAGLLVRLVAVTVYGWNALVAERLLMGAWPLLIGYAVLPWLLDAARRWRAQDRLPRALLVLVPLGCLSASAGLATAVAVLAGAAGKGRTTKAVLLVAAGNAPWLVAGLLHASSATSDSAAAEVFALRGEGSVPAPLAALTLGGIWNTAVQPEARTGRAGLGGAGGAGGSGRHRLPGLVAAYAGAGADRAAGLLGDRLDAGGADLAGAGSGRLGLGARRWCRCRAGRRPGAGPLRAAAGRAGRRGRGVLATRAPRERAARVALAVGAVLLPVALLPGLALGVGHRVEPADYPAAYDEARHLLEDRDGDVLVLPLSSYRAPAWNHRHLVLDPIGPLPAP